MAAGATEDDAAHEAVRAAREAEAVGEARMAAAKANEADIFFLEQAYSGMKQAVEFGGDYVVHDLRFHQGLLLASHNRMIVQMGRALSSLLRMSFEISTRIKEGPRESLPLHRAVLDAVIAHAPDQAERALMVLIEAANDDIDHVLATRRKLPRVAGAAKRLLAA